MSKANAHADAVSFEEFDLADRMRRSLRVAGLGVAEMAEALDVERNTVGSWINGRIVPRRASVMAWALKTGAPYEWLMNGTSSNDGPNLPPRD